MVHPIKRRLMNAVSDAMDEKMTAGELTAALQKIENECQALYTTYLVDFPSTAYRDVCFPKYADMSVDPWLGIQATTFALSRLANLSQDVRKLVAAGGVSAINYVAFLKSLDKSTAELDLLYAVPSAPTHEGVKLLKSYQPRQFPPSAPISSTMLRKQYEKLVPLPPAPLLGGTARPPLLRWIPAGGASGARRLHFQPRTIRSRFNFDYPRSGGRRSMRCAPSFQ